MAEQAAAPRQQEPTTPSLPGVVFNRGVSAAQLSRLPVTFPSPVEIGTGTTLPAETGTEDSILPGVSFAGDPVLPNQPIVEGILPYPTVASDPFAQIYPGTSDKWKTAAAHAATAAIEGAPTTAGMVTGMTMGIPGGPPGILAGTIIGGITGYLFGEKFVNPVVQQMAEDPAFLGGYARDPILSPLVPWAEGGETAGAGIATVPVGYALPVMTGGGLFSRFISNVGVSTRARPLLAAATELTKSAASGAAGGTAVYYNPENPGLRLGAEIVGGFFGPPTTLVTALASVGSVKDLVRGAMSSNRRAATDILTKLLRDSQIDPNEIITQLNAPRLIAETPTVAQITGSPLFAQLEASLARSDVRYGEAIANQGREAFSAYQVLVKQLTDVGTPASLQAAAEVRQQSFDDLLAARLKVAEENASNAIVGLTRTPGAEVQATRILQSSLDDSLKDMRGLESSLWNTAELDSLVMGWKGGKRIYTPRTLSTESTTRTFLEIADQAYSGIGVFPKNIQDMLADFGVNAESIARYRQGKLSPTYIDQKRKLGSAAVPPDAFFKVDGESVIPTREVGDLTRARTELLGLARAAAAGEDAQLAGMYATMASSLLDDLDTLQIPAFNDARTFSRKLNDVFTRTFADKISATTTSGARRMSPEEMVPRLFTGTGDMTARRMLDMEEAVDLMGDEYSRAVQLFGRNSPEAQKLLPLAEQSATRVASVRDAQTRLLRSAAADSIDPLTGRVNPLSLTRFVNENETILRRLDLYDELQDATTAEQALRMVIDRNSVLSRAVAKDSAFAKVLVKEKPTAVVAAMLAGNFPVRSMRMLLNTARRGGGQQAVDGLKSTIFDLAYKKATRGASFDPATFESVLFEPIALNQPSIMTLLYKSGAANSAETGRIRQLVAAMINIQNAAKAKPALVEELATASPLADLLVRVGALHVSSSVIPKGPGALSAASAVARTASNFFGRAPKFSLQALLKDATQDPELMRVLLTEAATPAEALKIRFFLQGYLLPAAINRLEYDPENPPMYELAPSEIESPLNRMPPRTQTPAPPTRGVPNNTAPAAGAPPPPAATAPPQASAQPSSRDMYRQLFPLDMA